MAPQASNRFSPTRPPLYQMQRFFRLSRPRHQPFCTLMKLKTIFHMMGLRPRPREYGYEVHEFDLRQEGRVAYAQWLHPSETRKSFRQDEVDHLRTLLRPGDVAIDIGAHTGDSTLPMALAVGATGHVLALEPNPYVYPILAANAELNRDKTSIEPLPFAATAEDGPIEFEYSDAGFCNGGRHDGISVLRHGHVFKLMVQGRNLERYLRGERSELIGRLKYIKTDAEGYDLVIIRSILKLIEETRPFIKAEIYKHTNRRQRLELFDTLRELGYRIHKIASDVDYFGEIIDADGLMKWRHYDILCVPV